MEETFNSLFKCGICQCTAKYPKKLNCQHSFCNECLVNYIRRHFGQSCFFCPVCNLKHSPNDQDTEIGENMLAGLEEDSLARDLHQFYCDGVNRPATSNAGDINQVFCPVHTRSQCCYYCPQCNLLACNRCKRDIHRQCRLQVVDRNMKNECFYKIRQVSSELNGLETNAEVTKSKLTSSIENVMPDNESSVSMVKSYYAELKEGVIKYLDEQERKVLEKAKELEEKEKSYLERDVSVCSSLLNSLRTRQQLATALQMYSSSKPSENMVLAGHLVKSVADYKNVLSGLEADAAKFFDLRFMINTELEDKLTDSDIVKIEVINSCHAGPLAVTFDQADTSEEESRITGMPPSDHMRGGSRQTSEEALPPPYTNAIHDSFILRPRQIESSVNHGVVPSAPPISEQPMDSYIANPTPCPLEPLYATSPAVPTAPPVFLSPVLNEGLGSPPLLVPGNEPMTRSISSAARTESNVQSSPKFAELIGLDFKDTVDVQLSGDDSVPCLVAMATFKEGFVIIDRSNHCMKVLSQRGSLLNVFDFGAAVEPWDVTAISDTECVVAAPEQSSLLILNYPCPRDGFETSISKTVKTGQYAQISFHKRTRILVGCRCPPFSAARLDLLNLDGHILKKIALDSRTTPRNLVVTETFHLIMCDVFKREAIFIDGDTSNSTPPIKFTGSRSHLLREPQGVALLPEKERVIVLDGYSGNLYITSYTGNSCSVLEDQMCLDGFSDPDIEYQIAVSADESTIAVADNTGYVSLFEMKYTKCLVETSL